MIYEVEYHIADYHGFIKIDADENDDNEIIIARTKSKLKKLCGSLPYGYESFKIKEEV